jgi:hypothetical protein
MQYDAPSAHRPLLSQRPEQHCALDVHELSAVVHEGLVAMGWHVPLLQLPVQQVLPCTGQAAPIERHCVVPHWPDMHAPLQQSVFATQGAVAGAQVVIDDAQVPFVASQMPEQHSAPNEQLPPKAEHITFASPPPAESPAAPSPPEDPTVPSPAVEPSPPLAPEELPFDPSESVPPELEPLLAVDPSWPDPEPLPLDARSALASLEMGASPLLPQAATDNAKTHKATPRKCLCISPRFVRVIP